MAVTREQVAQIYVATFNRAPLDAGLDYWTESGFTIEQIATSFFDQDEAQAIYTDDGEPIPSDEFVTIIFNNLFGREPAEAGLEYWSTALDDGTVSQAEMILAVANGATGDDADIVANKTKVGLYYADQGGEETTYYLGDIDETDESVDAAKDEIDHIVAGEEAFTLTADAAQVDEGGTVTYTVSTTDGSLVAADTTFNWEVQGEGSNPASPLDFSAGGNAGSVVLEAGQSSTTFTVAVANDALVEFNEGFIVTATGAGVVLTDTASITDVAVDNAAPVATAPSATSYAEKSAAGVTLVTVAATDNVGVTDFTISSGNPDEYFQIDAEGNISLTDAGAASALNNFNTLPNDVTLGVKAIDAAGNESLEVTVALTEADITAPELNSTTRTATTITMSFTDQSDMAALDPSIASAFSVLKSGTTAVTVGSVTIDGKNVILGLNSPLDDADLATVVYTKPAANGLADTAGNAVDSFTKTGIAKDITAPVVADQTFSYIESTPETPRTTTDVIATVLSADTDIDTFTITEGNGNDYFAIDDQGNITLTTIGLAASSTANDFEAVPNSFSLKVTATDNAGNVSTAATIGLTVTDDITDNLAAPIIASLTTGADPQAGVVLGSNNDDIISGLVSANAGETTFSSADFINTGDNGSEGDTLNIELRNANYTGGATIQNVENLKVTTNAIQNFNTLGMSSVSKIINNSSANTLTVQNMHKEMMAIDLNNIAGGVSAGVYQYATGELTGAEVATVTLLSNVGTSNAFSALTIGPAVAVVNSLGEINIDAKAGNGFITLTTDNTQTSLKTINVSGANALNLALAADQIATTATTINAASNSGGFTLTGLGAAAHTITGGSGNDFFGFGATLGTTDVINGGVGTDTLSANGAQLAAVTSSAKPTVSNIETLMIADDVGNTVTAIDASLFGGLVTNARVANQGTFDTAAVDVTAANVTVNGLTAAAGSSNNIRFDGDLGSVTAKAEVFTATFGATVDADTVTFDGTGVLALTAGQTAVQNAAQYTGLYNAVGAATWIAVDNGDGTVTFTSKATGPVVDIVTGDFVIASAGAGADVAVTAAVPTTQGEATVAGAYTFNVNNAQDANTANSVTLDMRGVATSAAAGITLNGVESVTIDTTNGTGAKAINLTDTGLTSLTVLGGQSVNLAGAQLGGSVSTINATGMVGAAALTVTLNAAATVGGAVTTAGGADVIVGSSLNDTISTGGGNDTITGLGGADKLIGGTGTDLFNYTAAGQTGNLVQGSSSTSTLTLDILTVDSGDTIQLFGDATVTAAVLGVLQVAGNLTTTLVTEHTIARTIGVYDAAANTFTVGATGANAMMLSYDNTVGDTAAGADLVADEAIILVGVTDVASVNATGLITV